MTTAEVAPHIVAKREIVQNDLSSTGTAVSRGPYRVTEYYIEAVKANEEDWVMLEQHIGKTTGEIIGMSGVVEDTSQDMTAETLKYDDSDDKLIFDGTTTGTAKVFIRMREDR